MDLIEWRVADVRDERKSPKKKKKMPCWTRKIKGNPYREWMLGSGYQYNVRSFIYYNFSELTRLSNITNSCMLIT